MVAKLVTEAWDKYVSDVAVEGECRLDRIGRQLSFYAGANFMFEDMVRAMHDDSLSFEDWLQSTDQQLQDINATVFDSATTYWRL